MTLSETYKFLESVKRIDLDIRKLQLKHDALQSCLLPKAITYDKDPVQTSPEDKMSEIASEVMDIEQELRKLAAMKRRRIQEVGERIATLENDSEQIVLLGFYVGNLPAPKVAEISRYSVRGVYKIRRRAVMHLAESVHKVHSAK